MTTIAERPTESPWGMMPGWGIVGDLTPPELIAGRKLRVLRRLIGVGLAVVLVLCGAGYCYSLVQHGDASDDLSSASAQTTKLQITGKQFAGITRIQTAVSSINGQIATVMVDDVDLVKTLTELRDALPNTMSIQNLGVTLASAATAGAGNSATTGLDVSGHMQVGTVTISGSGRRLNDLATYVDRLAAIKGVVNIIPTSNQLNANTTQFNVALSLSDQLYSHRFDTSAKAGK